MFRRAFGCGTGPIERLEVGDARRMAGPSVRAMAVPSSAVLSAVQ